MNTPAASLLSDVDLRFLTYLESRAQSHPLPVERWQRLLEETSDRLAAVVLKLGLLAEEDLAAAFVTFAQLPALGREPLPAEPVPVDGLCISFLRAREVVPIGIDARHLRVACWDALDEYTVQALHFATGLDVSRYVTTRRVVLTA